MSKIDSAVLPIFRSQGGIAARDQLLERDMSARQIQHRVTNGSLIVVRRGVYLHPAFPVSDRMKLFALTIAGAGFVGHRRAGRSYGFDVCSKAGLEVTTRPNLGLRFAGIRIHESTQLDTADITYFDGLPTSGVERTIMDCCAVIPERWKILSMIDQARSRGLTNMGRLITCLETHAERGRNGTVRFREALEHAQQLDRIESGPISHRAVQVLASEGIRTPKLEVAVYDRAGVFVALVDGAWDIGYVHMYDGFTYHRSRRETTKKDIEQRNRLRSLGLVVDEFTAEHVFRDPLYLVTTTKAGLSTARSVALRSAPQWEFRVGLTN